MKISEYKPQQKPVLVSIIRDMIMDRRIKRMSSTSLKPQLSTASQSQKPIQQIHKIVKLVPSPTIVRFVKRKEDAKAIKKEFKLQEKYNRWLLNYLHLTSQLEIKANVIPVSMLGTMEQPDYPFSYENPHRDRKEYPHRSNIIKLTDIPRQRHIAYLPTPLRPAPYQVNIYQTTIFRQATIINFVQMTLRQEWDSLDDIAQKLNISMKAANLLFDCINDTFELEEECDKLQRFRLRERIFSQQCQRVCQSLKKRIQTLFQNKQPPSALIPREQIMVSLAQLHKMIIQFEY